MTRIVVISDTHTRSLKGLPQGLVKELSEADIVVHCGDYTYLVLLEELRRVARRFIGVYGNMDPREIRDELPDKTVFEVEGRRIGVIHPPCGGPPWGIEKDIAKEFEGVDIILFGHTHDVCHETIGGVVFLNPGQAYPSFRTAASAGIVTIGQEGMDVEIRMFE
ncbi:MAG: metallophosphoesterase [Dehalococcoidia bacterium]|nr:metallophosphoesterase [Dehalococcoidia bacterium]